MRSAPHELGHASSQHLHPGKAPAPARTPEKPLFGQGLEGESKSGSEFRQLNWIECLRVGENSLLPLINCFSSSVNLEN